MGAVYTVEFENVAVVESRDFFELRPVADRPLRIIGLVIAQSTEFGDAAEEMMRWQIIRGHATTGSGGATPTPRPVLPDQATVGFAADTNNTTLAAGGTPVNLHSDVFNVRTGLIWTPPPKLQIGTDNGEGFLVVRLLSTPTDSISFNGTIYVAEGIFGV